MSGIDRNIWKESVDSGTIHHPKGLVSDNLGRLYATGDLTDFTIVTSCSTEFKVHKCVISQKSTVFRATFTDGSKVRCCHPRRLIVVEADEISGSHRMRGW